MKKIMMSIFAGILSISCMTLPIEGKTRCSSEVSRAADDFYDGYQYDETTGCYYELLPYEDAYVKVFLPKNTEAFMIPAKILIIIFFISADPPFFINQSFLL